PLPAGPEQEIDRRDVRREQEALRRLADRFLPVTRNGCGDGREIVATGVSPGDVHHERGSLAPAPRLLTREPLVCVAADAQLDTRDGARRGAEPIDRGTDPPRPAPGPPAPTAPPP